MTVLDSYALAALLTNEAAAEEVAALVEAGSSVIPAANLAETADVLGRVYGIDTARTRAAVESLVESAGLRIRPLQEQHAWRACAIRVNRYHRTERSLSLGDCLLLGSTADGERLATADPHVLDTAQAEGIAWIALPDSRGRRHTPRN